MSLDIRLLEDDSVDEPDVLNVWGSYGDFELVGRGKITNQHCGTYFGIKGCLRTDLHNKSIFNKDNVLVNCRDKISLHKVINWCNKPSCPVCFKYGWAVREARNIEVRLKEASKRFGQIEHMVCSVPSRDYGLKYKPLRRKSIKVLKNRGVIGGSQIFHGFRYNLCKRWYWSPHFHILGFILGGYGKCRSCRDKVCMGFGNFGKCNGFEARTRRLNVKDGYIVKVFGKRKTVNGTAWYQLNHSSVKKGVRRFHVATWFGVCSYRRLKVTVELKKRVCPICLHDLVWLRYFGCKHFVKDKDSPFFERDSFEDFMEDGRIVWVERQPTKYGSGSYEY